MSERVRVRVRVRVCCKCPLWCPFSCKGRCTESQHTGLRQCAFPKGEAPSAAPSHDGLTTSPSPVRFESGSRALALFLLDTTSLRQTTGCVSPDRLASRAEPSSLCSTKPDHFGRDEHTRRPRHPRMSAWATGSYDSPQLKNRPPPLSPTWVLQVASLISEQLGRASFPIPSRFRGRERQRDESRNPKDKETNPDEKDSEPATPGHS